MLQLYIAHISPGTHEGDLAERSKALESGSLSYLVFRGVSSNLTVVN